MRARTQGGAGVRDSPQQPHQTGRAVSLAGLAFVHDELLERVGLGLARVVPLADALEGERGVIA